MRVRAQGIAVALAAAGAIAAARPAEARMVCTIVADAASGAILVEDGDCRTRVTPASTFKVPLAVMGYDAGILSGPDAPALPFRDGYADWGGAAWKTTTTPVRWLRFSVVWYSQLIARDLGADRLARYAQAFGYGNADFSGDPGKDNGLERAWIGSSLKVSPAEQVGFLARLVNGTLPATREAMRTTAAIAEAAPAGGGWTIKGKTGSAFPRRADGSLDRARGWGWYVGWATKGGRTVTFARLDQDERKESGAGGLRARAALLAAWPDLTGRLSD